MKWEFAPEYGEDIARENIKNISILCLGMVPKEYLEDCIKNNITITINSLDYVEEIVMYAALIIYFVMSVLKKKKC